MKRIFCAKFCVAVAFVLAVAAVTGCGSVCRAGTDATLYDVDFNGPPHVVGAAPAFGAGPFPRNTPTSGGQIFMPTGSVKVVAFNGPMTDRPVRLTAIDGTPNDPTFLGGADLQFDLSDPQLSSLDVFHASVDVLPSDISRSTGLGIIFDAPSIHLIDFAPDGNIRVEDATGVDLVVGQYSPESIYTVQLTFDRAAAEWLASINGTPVYQGPVAGTDLKTFRIAMTTGDTQLSSSAFVDNIKITAVVPEPGSLCSAGMAATYCLLFAKQRRTRKI